MQSEIRYSEHEEKNETSYLDRLVAYSDFLLRNYYFRKGDFEQAQDYTSETIAEGTFARLLYSRFNGEEIPFGKEERKAMTANFKGVIKELMLQRFLDIYNPEKDRYSIYLTPKVVDQNNGCDLIIFSYGQPIIGIDVKGQKYERDVDYSTAGGAKKKKREVIARSHDRRKKRQAQLGFPVITLGVSLTSLGFHRLINNNNDELPSFDYDIDRLISDSVGNAQNPDCSFNSDLESILNLLAAAEELREFSVGLRQKVYG